MSGKDQSKGMEKGGIEKLLILIQTAWPNEDGEGVL